MLKTSLLDELIIIYTRVMDSLPAQQQQSQKSNNTALWLIGGIACGVIVIGAVVLLFRITQSKVSLPFLSSNVSPTNAILQANQNKPEGAIIKVGDEYIYKQDLEYEMKYAPGNDQDKQSLLEKKLVQDSIILQGAQADGLLKLDGTIYNSPNKDYQKRIKTISEIEKSVNDKVDRITGTVITIWFFNNGIQSPLGYEKSRDVAKQKITEYHQKVARKQITIDQALELIKVDKSLDPLGEHKNNAGFTFDIIKGEQGPTPDDNFNNIIWGLNQGQLSPVTVIKNKVIPGDPDALYVFGQVKSKTTGQKFIKYEDWLKAKQKNYAIMYF